MSTALSKQLLAELTAHALLQANAHAAVDQLNRFRPLHAVALHVVVKQSGSIVEFRDPQNWFLNIWQPLTYAQANVLHQAILCMPYGRLVSDSPLTALTLVKATSPETFNSLLDLLTSPRDVATISQFLRSIAFAAECPGA